MTSKSETRNASKLSPASKGEDRSPSKLSLAPVAEIEVPEDDISDWASDAQELSPKGGVSDAEEDDYVKEHIDFSDDEFLDREAAASAARLGAAQASVDEQFKVLGRINGQADDSDDDDQVDTRSSIYHGGSTAGKSSTGFARQQQHASGPLPQIPASGSASNLQDNALLMSAAIVNRRKRVEAISHRRDIVQQDELRASAAQFERMQEQDVRTKQNIKAIREAEKEKGKAATQMRHEQQKKCT